MPVPDPLLYGGGPFHPITVPGALGGARMFTGANMLDAYALAVATGLATRIGGLDEAPESFARQVFDIAQALLDERDRRAAGALAKERAKS